MMLTEAAAVPLSALPIQAFRNHLRLGTGFADDGLGDPVIEAALRAAIGAIEARTGKALIARNFIFTIQDWRDPEAQALPVAPVRAIVSVTMADRLGVSTLMAPGYFRLVRDLQRPLIAAAGSLLPQVPAGGSVTLVFEAGFGGWSDVPADLAQSVFLLAAQYYENRHDAGGRAAMPFGVMALIERWRNVRVLGGGAR